MTTVQSCSGARHAAGAEVQRKLAITVLAGGPSGEHEVSLQSGRCVAEALASRGHDVQIADIAPDNLGALAREVDCVFVALHGRFGEDGEVQRILEERSLAYTGSGPAACALAMDKAASKDRFAKLGIPTPRYTVATDRTIREAVAAWKPPVVAKPVSEGSSLACHIIREYQQFRLTVELLVAEYGRCLIEDYIPGLELTVGILGDRALPVLEIRTRREFYDYQAKYLDDDTQYDFDINLPAELLGRIVKMSLAAHRALGCRDFSRVDWRVDARRLEPYLLEVNVIPGLTSHSLLPKAAARVGIPMPELCQIIVDSAMRRSAGRRP
jgi:D-alanine-D-alanine ligase